MNAHITSQHQPGHWIASAGARKFDELCGLAGRTTWCFLGACPHHFEHLAAPGDRRSQKKTDRGRTTTQHASFEVYTVLCWRDWAVCGSGRAAYFLNRERMLGPSAHRIAVHK